MKTISICIMLAAPCLASADYFDSTQKSSIADRVSQVEREVEALRQEVKDEGYRSTERIRQQIQYEELMYEMRKDRHSYYDKQ